MIHVVTKQGCHRCCELVGKLSSAAKSKVILLHGLDCSGFLGLGDLIEAIIHYFGLHKVWAFLHGQKSDWVCPSCMRRKTWLNKLWYFGPPETKALWVALVESQDLAIDAQYPFIVSTDADGQYFFRPISDSMVEDASTINDILEGR